jgi:hypothetical protein
MGSNVENRAEFDGLASGFYVSKKTNWKDPAFYSWVVINYFDCAMASI